MATTPGAFEPPVSTSTSSVTPPPPTGQPTSIHLNCGGATVTDSAGIVWLSDTPYIISFNSYGSTGATTIAGISAPLDPDDPAHQVMMRGRRWDFSSTLNGGPPGVVEWSLSLEGNFSYRLRIWGYDWTTNATGNRVQTISYDYGAGTTETFTQQFDIVGEAGSSYAFADYEETFTITATGAQSVRLMLAGGGAGGDPNPVCSAIEITGSALSVAVPAGPSKGKMWYEGQRIWTQQGLRFEPASGRLEFKGQTPTLAGKRADAQAARGVWEFRSNAPSFSTGSTKSPTRGNLSIIGSVVEAGVFSPMPATPSAGRLQFVGAAVEHELLEAIWGEQPRDNTQWTEIPPDG